MSRTKCFLRRWFSIGLCCGFSLALGVLPAEAKKKGKCEGTTQQRKQKMKLRDLTNAQLEEMITEYKKTLAAERKLMKETAIRRIEREYEEHLAAGQPFVYDILIISGGGAKGAFGSGFFEGWGEIETGPFARPEFDMITGVSTGALLAPFAAIGTDESFAKAVEFYANPQPNWIKKRGALAVLPKHVSLFNNCHLQDTIRGAMDRTMIEALAEAAEDDRLLLISATNLDVGVGHVFDVGQEARKSLENTVSDRVASILLASSAIPGAFPPIEIDGMLYADGGATSNLFIANFPGPDGIAARFRESHPDGSFPKLRIWIVVNQKLRPLHEVTQPRWISVTGRSLATLTSTTQLFALALIKDMVHEARVEHGADAELFLVSIPEDAPENTTENMFDQAYMLQLQDLGRRMGADPSSWNDEVPSAYRVEGKWLGSE
jgi:predicted acylesterase/phospholipase RssA